MMLRWPLRAAWLALLVVAPVVIAQEEAPQVELQLAAPTFDASSRVLALRGSSNLPAGTVLQCQAKLGESSSSRQQGIVGDKGGFEIRFPPLKQRCIILPANYRFEVSCNPADQPPKLREALAKLPPASASIEAQVGDPGEAASLQEEIHKSLIDITRQLRTLFMSTESHGSFIVARIVNARRKFGGNLPDNESNRILADWERYGSEHFEDNFRALMMNFKDYREGCFISPFSEAERELESIFNLTRKWYAVSWLEICKTLGVDPPREALDEAAFPKKVLQPQVAQGSERLYAALKVEPQDWVQVNAFRPEEGVIKDGTYMSKTSKFEITLPNEEWQFDQQMIHPQIRVRLVPTNPLRTNDIVIAVELRDYPECESPQDLDAAVEIDCSERWPGYKKLRGGPQRVADSQMDDGKRPGFLLDFITLTPQKRTFRVIDYALYCRWFKRTYSVIVIGDKDRFAQYEKDVEKIKQSFHVLDKEN